MKKIRSLFKFLASPYLAVTLLSVILTTSALGALMNADYIKNIINKDANQLVFHQGWFLALNMLLLVNILFCTLKQFITGAKRYKRLKKAVKQQVGEGDVTSAHCRRAQHAIPLSVFISPIFHLGLSLLMIGAFVDFFCGFTGTLPVPPGVLIEDRLENYINVDSRPLSPSRDGNFSILLREINYEYFPDGVKTLGSAVIYKEDEEVLSQVIDSSDPIWMGPVSICKDEFHYYVNYTVNDKKGALIDKHSLGLNTYLPDNATIYSRQDFQPQGTSYRFDMEFFPNVKKTDGKYVSASYQMLNPAVMMTVYNGKKTVYSGLVKLGETVELADGNRFNFRSVTPYLYLRIQTVVGTYILVFGFVLFLAGLILYYTVHLSIITNPGKDDNIE